jgi:pimeloyl-ACP methyl ester carboxylesterase
MLRRLALVRILTLGVIAALLCLGPAWAGNGLGVVLLHGKRSGPQVFQGLAGALEKEGFLVAKPEMPWSRSRYLDKTFEAALDEIAAAVNALQQKGANRVVVAGHSMGAVAALGYAAARGGLTGVILLAPGHFPGFPGFQKSLGDSLAQAQEMIKSGRGEKTGEFLDKNQGRVFPISTTAQIYYSYFSPEGPMAPGRNAARLNPKIPVLVILGDQDPLAPSAKSQVFAKLPANPLYRLVTVAGGHIEVPSESQEEVLRWLKGLPQ